MPSRLMIGWPGARTLLAWNRLHLDVSSVRLAPVVLVWTRALLWRSQVSTENHRPEREREDENHDSSGAANLECLVVTRLGGTSATEAGT
jgi:hypothetical protein